MTTLQKLHGFLTELQTGVQGKMNAMIDDGVKKTKTRNLDKIRELNCELYSHTEGQLYELNYILENFWRIINEA